LEEKNEPWFVLSLAKGLAVIKAFNADNAGLKVSEVAARCDLSRAAARRFLMTLAKLGYVACRDDRYFLQPAALDLGYAYLSSMQLNTLVQPELDNITAATGESCSFGVLSKTDVVFIARSPARRMINIHIGIGSRLPAHTTSLGKVLLAYLERSKFDRIVDHIKFVSYTPATITDANKLRREMKSVREKGYGIALGELEADVASIAFPVMGASGNVVAAINISTSASRLKEEGVVASFVELLAAASTRLGGVLRTSPQLGLNLHTAMDAV
jgi:IclR family transcriptional regulator, pca regulon regulatory protein